MSFISEHSFDEQSIFFLWKGKSFILGIQVWYMFAHLNVFPSDSVNLVKLTPRSTLKRGGGQKALSYPFIVSLTLEYNWEKGVKGRGNTLLNMRDMM